MGFANSMQNRSDLPMDKGGRQISYERKRKVLDLTLPPNLAK